MVNRGNQLSKFINKISYYLATGFGSGFLPAPGTAGSVVAVVIWFFSLQYLPVWGQGCFIVMSFFVGVLIIQQASLELSKQNHNNPNHNHDPKQIVWDEFVGMWIALLFIPSASFYSVIIAFSVFRFFDIFKPFPIGWLDQKLDNSWGVLLDDVVAGLFAGIFTWVIAALVL
jgi:phosphatidylglycerophosphatase A